MIFYYCERTTLEAFGEPINALSNLAFIFCGLILIFKKKIKFNPLPYLVIFIGISSFLFHYLPTKLFSILDIFSIALFVIFYNILLTKNILKYPMSYSILSSLLLLLISYFTGTLLLYSIIGSSSFYLGILIYMLFILFLIRKIENRKYFLFAIILFTISILFRTIDNFLCNYFLYGTHFIWHILNSLVLYYLVIYIRLTNRTSPKKPA